MDYAVEKCIDGDGNKRCSTPFLVQSDVCYNIEWKTDGTVSHTTVEVRDAGSSEMVYYRDTNGEWTPEKGEVSFLGKDSKGLELTRDFCSLCTWISSLRSGRLVMIPLSMRLRLVRSNG